MVICFVLKLCDNRIPVDEVSVAALRNCCRETKSFFVDAQAYSDVLAVLKPKTCLFFKSLCGGHRR